MALDLAISLGPACQTAFNLRRFTGIRRAFPFDWWITPLHAAAAAIESRFELAIEPGNLEVTADRHSALNRPSISCTTTTSGACAAASLLSTQARSHRSRPRSPISADGS